MSTVRDLHTKAMDEAEAAALAAMRGDPRTAADATRRAFQLELEAARLLADFSAQEPTRSVIHRSAAALALDCGEVAEAERLIYAALAGSPPREIAEELKNMLEDVGFRRHLVVKGITLQPDEFQVTIAGDAIGYGIAKSKDVIERIQSFQRLVYRTFERKTNKPYRERGGPSKGIADMVYMSTPRAASFAMTLKIGSPDQLALPGFDIGKEIVDEILDCMDIVSRNDLAALEKRIPNDSYRRNFVALAKSLAPDGHDVNLVGFTAVRDGQERTVVLRREDHTPLSAIPVAVAPSLGDGQTVEITGELRFTDSTKQSNNRIKLIDEHGKSHTVVVPEGMMTDIVRPLWEDRVSVRGKRAGKEIILEDIRRVE